MGIWYQAGSSLELYLPVLERLVRPHLLAGILRHPEHHPLVDSLLLAVDMVDSLEVDNLLAVVDNLEVGNLLVVDMVDNLEVEFVDMVDSLPEADTVGILAVEFVRMDHSAVLLLVVALERRRLEVELVALVSFGHRVERLLLVEELVCPLPVQVEFVVYRQIVLHLPAMVESVV